MDYRSELRCAAPNIAVALLALFSVACGVAFAGDHQGAYAGGGLGFGSMGLTNEAYDYSINPDKNVLIFEGHGGYRFNRYGAVEGQLFGSANGNSNSAQRLSLAGLSGRVLAMAPVSDVVDLYAVFGFYVGSSEVGFSDTVRESGAVLGAGIQMNFGGRGQYGVRGAYEVYKGSELLDQLNGFTVSFQYNFF